MARRRPLTITRRNGRRQNSLKSTTLREFDGGWNVIDNDLNLSPKFAKVLTNVLRLKDGSIGVRPGTRLVRNLRYTGATTLELLVDADGEYIVDADDERIVSVYRALEFDGTLDNDPFAFSNTSDVVTVTHEDHGFVTGHEVTFDGAATAHGVPADDLNTTHVVTYVTEDTYTITVATPATSTGSGGGAAVQYVGENDIVGDRIINATYFDDRIIAVSRDGTVVEIDGLGNSRVIFNDQIADAQPDSPDGWGLTEFVSFAVFNGELIICNGIDKPLIVNFENAEFPCLYLADLATSSNANTPICRYVVAMAEYLVMAGDITAPGTVYISNRNTSGTWPGDGAPNDAVSVDVGTVAQSQNNIIRGIARFRETLIVAFDDVISFGVLGTYVEDVHTPDFSDSVFQYGTISHRSMINLGNDLLMSDPIGVPSVSRSQFVGDLRPSRVSQLIDSEIQRAILALTVGATSDRVFSVFDQREGRYMLFVPDASTYDATTETAGYIFTLIPSLKINAWAKFEGWNWTCGFRSALGRVFFFEDAKLFVSSADEDPIYADFIGDVLKDDVEDPAEGKPISFAWEFPWADFDKRMNIKILRYLSFDARGSGEFNAKVFIDNIYRDPDTSELNPTLALTFSGGDGSGFGEGDQPYGGELQATDERNRAATTKFKIMKLRIDGSTQRPLSIVSATFAYQDGSIQR